MVTHVYANGREIASKSADGSSKHAMPDVCHTPPATASPTPIKPFPPGVPVLYSNTCHARDISNGSRSVFILGKEIALENHSYFSVSEGDDFATKKLAKGIISSAVKGLCYFQTWSPNVFVEGRAVARHLDMVSHNHSNPTNTPLFPYLSRGWFGGHDCKKEQKRIEEACNDSKNKPKSPKKRNPTDKSPANHWTRDFCTGLQFGANFEDKAALREELEDLLDNAQEQFQNLSTGFWSALGSAAASGAGKLAMRSGARIVVGAAAGGAAGLATGPGAVVASPTGAAVVGGVMTVVSIGDTLVTVVSGLWNLPESWAAASAAEDLFNDAKGLFEGLDQILDENGELNITDRELSDAIGEWQDMIAKINPCLRARKCNLVPHTSPAIPSLANHNQVETSRSGGCCLGQQGHHLVPKAMMKEVNCPGYRNSTAPTVCVEGNRTNKGSHKRIHGEMDGRLRLLREQNKISPQETISMKDALDAAVASHQTAFPLSRCREKCIRAQLEEYYGKLCPGAQVKAKIGSGGRVPNDSGDVE